jgi:hypothetical protein
VFFYKLYIIIKIKEPKGKRGKGRKNLDFDDEDDYKEAKDAPKPSAVTLFDLFKTKLDIKGKILLFS